MYGLRVIRPNGGLSVGLGCADQPGPKTLCTIDLGWRERRNPLLLQDCAGVFVA